jgi:streptogramin lyase
MEIIMSTTLYYNGDSNILGNLTLSQNITSVSGQFLTKNINASFFTSVSFVTSGKANVTTANVTSLTRLPVVTNVYASNSLATTNILARTMNLSALNLTTFAGPVTVTGNLTLTDTLTTGNLTSTLINTGQLSFNSFFTPGFGIGTSTPGASLTVGGNVVLTDTLSTPVIIAQTMNVTGTANVNVFMWNQIITPGADVYDLTVIGGTQVANTLVYSEDLVRRSPHLAPNAINADQIQAWIQGTCNAPSKSWWPPGAVLSNSAPVGSLQYAGSVLLPDGTILFAPLNSKGTIGRYNPGTGQFSASVPSGAAVTGSYFGGVLTPSGNVVFAPATSGGAIGIYNPVANQFQKGPTPPGGPFTGCVLDPLGNVVMTGQYIVSYNPTLNSIVASIGPFPGTLRGGVLGPNGIVTCIPGTNSSIVLYNPYTISVTTVSSGPAQFSGGVLTPSGSIVCVPWGPTIGVLNSGIFTGLTINTPAGAFEGGSLLPNGNVIFFSNSSANVGMFDPVALAYSNYAPGSGFAGGTLARDGSVVMCPRLSGNVGIVETGMAISREFCLSPYFNKF